MQIDIMCFIVDKNIFLPYRVNYYINNGWAGYIIYPHAPQPHPQLILSMTAKK